ncbi:hypothetical protein Tco_0888309 [Tanacetum coccineum]
MMQNASLMSLEELIAWDFLHVDSVADELGLHDKNWFILRTDRMVPEIRWPSANLQVVLKKKKKGRIEAGKGRLGGLVALNNHEVDNDQQLKS